MLRAYDLGRSRGAEETFSSGDDPVSLTPAHSLAVSLVVYLYPEAANPSAQVI